MIPLLLLLLPFSQGQLDSALPNAGTGAQQVYITMFPTATNPRSVSRVTWSLPTSQAPVYCVSSGGVSGLRFTCPDCNSTTVDGWLARATSRIEGLGVPAVQIIGLTLNKTMNGKGLVCEGDYEDMATQGTATATASAVMDIQYLERPVISNAKGEGPVETSAGNRFYLQRGGGSMELRCRADGNPNPTKFQWFRDGASLGNGQSYNVNQQLLGESISCAATSDAKGQKDSEAVKISPWDTPALISPTLANVARDPKNNGVFQGGKVQIGKTVKMTCIASGNPQPTIQWLVQPSGSQGRDGSQVVLNATCVTSASTICRPGQTSACSPRGVTRNTRISNTVYVVTSECSLSVSNYSFAGSYWCSACNKVSATSQHCQPSVTRAPATAAPIGVFGGPMRATAPPSAFQEDDGALISVYYCADPVPQARQIFWTIGDERLNIGQSLEHFRAEAPRPNGTSCYTAQLRISPVTEEDIAKSFTLTVTNSVDTVRIPVGVRGLLASEAEEASGADVGLIVGLTLGILLFLCLLIPACLWWRRLACFAGPRKAKPEKFATNIAPEHVRSEPTPVTGYGQSEPASYGAYGGVYKKGPGAGAGGVEKETLSYAALDLVSEPPPAGGRSSVPPPDYAHLAHPQPTYAPQAYQPHAFPPPQGNSVV